MEEYTPPPRSRNGPIKWPRFRLLALVSIPAPLTRLQFEKGAGYTCRDWSDPPGCNQVFTCIYVAAREAEDAQPPACWISPAGP